MSRSRASAKDAGRKFNADIARALHDHIDDVIEVRNRNGSKDRGDIAGLRHLGRRVVVECKNWTTMQLAQWAHEAEIERGHDDALVGVVAHKRHGRGDPLEQWITMTVRDFIALLTGERPEDPS